MSDEEEWQEPMPEYTVINFPPANWKDAWYYIAANPDDEPIASLFPLGPHALCNELKNNHGYTDELIKERAKTVKDLYQQRTKEIADAFENGASAPPNPNKFWESMEREGLVEAIYDESTGERGYRAYTDIDIVMMLTIWYFLIQLGVLKQPPDIDPREMEVRVAPDALNRLLEQGYSYEDVQKIHDESVRSFKSGEAFLIAQDISDEEADKIFEALKNRYSMRN